MHKNNGEVDEDSYFRYIERETTKLHMRKAVITVQHKK